MYHTDQSSRLGENLELDEKYGKEGIKGGEENHFRVIIDPEFPIYCSKFTIYIVQHIIQYFKWKIINMNEEKINLTHIYEKIQ